MTAETAYGDREPVRLPMWVAAVGAAGLTFAVAMLTGGAWRPSLAGVLTGLGPVLFGTEVARGRAWSPLSVLQAAKEARMDEAGSNSSFVPVEPAAWGSPPPPVGE